MKSKLFICIIVVTFSNSYSQANYSDPKDVADKYLKLFIQGKRLEASKLYGTENSNDQILILLQQMVMKDIPLVNKTCNYVIDSCKVGKLNKTAKCFYSKGCTDKKENQKGVLTMKKIDDKWLVEYIWRRDKYL